MRWIVGTLLLLSSSWLTAQTTHFEFKSVPIKLKILNDVTPPSLTLNLGRTIEKGYRFVQRDTVITLAGTVTDSSGLASLEVNGATPYVNPTGGFRTYVHLIPGKNLIHFKAVDKRKNKTDTTLIVYQKSNADTTAPEIVITEPSLGRGFTMVMKTPTLRVSGIVADDGPLAALYVNNIRIDSARNGRFFCYVPTESLLAVKVRAVDSSGNVAVDSVVLPTHYFSAEPVNVEMPTPGKYFALLIGVDKYPFSLDLKNPVHDAANLGTILVSLYTFDRENTTILRNPTRDKILESFEQIKKKIGAEDNFLVFYAGHGFMDKEAEQGYWWPSDANPESHSKWISNSDIRDQLKRIKAKHTLLIADACFSGSVFRTTREVVGDAPIPIVEAYKRTSRTALTSGEEDVPDESVFMRLLSQALQLNPEKFLRANRLYDNLSDQVISNSPNRQMPQYGKIQEAGDSGGDFVFVKRPVQNSKPNH